MLRHDSRVQLPRRLSEDLNASPWRYPTHLALRASEYLSSSPCVFEAFFVVEFDKCKLRWVHVSRALVPSSFVLRAYCELLLVSGELPLPPPVHRGEASPRNMALMSLSESGGSPAVGCATGNTLQIATAMRRERKLVLATGSIVAHPAASSSMSLRDYLAMPWFQISMLELAEAFKRCRCSLFLYSSTSFSVTYKTCPPVCVRVAESPQRAPAFPPWNPQAHNTEWLTRT